MSWNYRVVKTDHPGWMPGDDPSVFPRYRYGVHEAYYDDDGQVHSWTAEPVAVYVESGVESLVSTLDDALRAAKELPVIDGTEESHDRTTN